MNYTVTIKQVRYATLIVQAEQPHRARNVALNVITNDDFDRQNPFGEVGDTGSLEVAIEPEPYYGTAPHDALAG